MHWYAEHGRHTLPWRCDFTPNTPDAAYHVWISEIMLQQTQVVTVLDYYHRFLASFPDVATLAAADEADVLRHWEGLGYYRRARQLHAAAKVVMEKHHGTFPTTFEAVLALPGIGRYTAGAILSFAMNQPLPSLEANTARLHARLLGLRQPITTNESQKSLWATAEDWVSMKNAEPRDINAALMDLGNLVCTPKAPRCDACPLASRCEALRQGAVDSIPVAGTKTQYESRHEAALILRRSARSKQICLLRYAEKQRWASLWDFPRTEIPENAPLEETLRQFARETLGLEITLGKRLCTLRHGVTKYRIQLDCFHAVASNPRSLRTQTPAGGEIRWTDTSQLQEFPLSSTGRQLAEMLEKRPS